MFKLITILLKSILVLAAIVWIYNTIDKSTEPQPEIEEKTREQAQKYLDTVFKDGHFVIYDITFDASHQLYDYAAMVRNEENNIEFRVFFNNGTGEMDDDYVEMKWKDDLSDDILPFIQEHFGKETTFYVGYEDLNHVSVAPNNLGDYKDYDGRPYIQLFVQHPKSVGDEKKNNELIKFLKMDCGLKHAVVVVSYYKDQELLMEDNWLEEF